MNYSKQIKAMTFSFSRLSSYEQCPYQWYKRYIEEDKGLDNFYAQAGALVHELLERIIKKEITIEDAIVEFGDRYEDECYEDIPTKIKDNMFEKVVTYFAELDENTLDGYEILGVEKEVHFKVGPYKATGYIDLLLRDKDGKIVLIDHKSAAYPLAKNGTVLRGKDKTYLERKRQLYLYSKAVKEEYGEFPAIIGWNHFKDQKILTIPFNEKEYNEAIEWAEATVNKIALDKEFLANKDYFYCHNLCAYRDGNCEYLDEEEEEN